MDLIKTKIGWEALQNPDVVLKPRMRQILILANGSHSRDSIHDLLERDIGAELHWLLQSGFLEQQVNWRYAVNHLRRPRALNSVRQSGRY